MEFKRGEKFQQPTVTPTPVTDNIIRRGEKIQTNETKEPPKQDLGLVRGAKVQEEKKDLTIQRGVKVASTTPNEIKEEKKSAPKETSQSDTITKGNMISRAKPSETPTPTTNTNTIQRGTAASTTPANTGFVRGAALQKGTANTEEKKTTDTKDGGWRKK